MITACYGVNRSRSRNAEYFPTSIDEWEVDLQRINYSHGSFRQMQDEAPYYVGIRKRRGKSDIHLLAQLKSNFTHLPRCIRPSRPFSPKLLVTVANPLGPLKFLCSSKRQSSQQSTANMLGAVLERMRKIHATPFAAPESLHIQIKAQHWIYSTREMMKKHEGMHPHDTRTKNGIEHRWAPGVDQICV